jgi:hypothetical protein
MLSCIGMGIDIESDIGIAVLSCVGIGIESDIGIDAEPASGFAGPRCAWELSARAGAGGRFALGLRGFFAAEGFLGARFAIFVLSPALIGMFIGMFAGIGCADFFRAESARAESAAWECCWARSGAAAKVAKSVAPIAARTDCSTVIDASEVLGHDARCTMRRRVNSVPAHGARDDSRRQVVRS